MIDFTEKNIQKSLWKEFKHHRFHLFNSYFFDEESDFLCMTGANYLMEGEIKLTYGDFKADFKKKRAKLYKKYKEPFINVTYGNRYKRTFERRTIDVMPNYFFYACPKGIIPENEIPDYAGLIYLSQHSRYTRYLICDRIRLPKLLHKNKFDNYKKLANKLYWKYLTELIDYKWKNK